MTLEDAAKLLQIDGEVNPESVKKAYRRASAKYHPDKGGSCQMMQAVNAAYEVLKGFSGTISAGDTTYPDSLNDAINKVIGLEGVHIEVCGAWVWITGNTLPYREILGKKGAGFFWASKKKAWYYRPSDWKSKSRGHCSLDDIRELHGSQVVRKKSRKEIAV